MVDQKWSVESRLADSYFSRKQLVYSGERDKFLLLLLFTHRPQRCLRTWDDSGISLHVVAQYQFYSPSDSSKSLFAIELSLVQVIDVSGSNTDHVYRFTSSFTSSMTSSNIRTSDLSPTQGPRWSPAYDMERGELGGHTGNLPPTPHIQIIQMINHSGEVNCARYMPQYPDLIATKAVAGEIFIFEAFKWTGKRRCL